MHYCYQCKKPQPVRLTHSTWNDSVKLITVQVSCMVCNLFLFQYFEKLEDIKPKIKLHGK